MTAPRSVHDLLELLNDWRKLPSYRMEPRVDPFAALYLHGFLQEMLNVPLRADIIPEFPLRRGTLFGDAVPGANKSKKVDFALLSTDSRLLVLVEFKTDSGSRNDSQDNYLAKASGLTVGACLHGITQISSASKYTEKYAFLAEKLSAWGLALSPEGGHASSATIRPVYLQPKPGETGEKDVFDFNAFAKFIEQQPGDLAATLATYFRQWAMSPHEGAN
jgi:hypothetical protein